jgi:hypothetical protein
LPAGSPRSRSNEPASQPNPDRNLGPRLGLTVEQITALLGDIGDILTALADADPRDKAQVYRQLGLRLTYDPDTQTARAEIDLGVPSGFGS